MTTYAASPTQPTLPTPAPPTPRPPQQPARPPSMPRSRTGILIAATAFVIALAATTITAAQLAQPRTAEQHTVNVIPVPPTLYSASDIQAAKTAACTAWDQAARSTALASKASATALEADPDWKAPAPGAALAAEKRTGLVAVENLRLGIPAATPPAVADLLNQWITLTINELHAINQRDWDGAEKVQQQSNELVDKVVTECGLR